MSISRDVHTQTSRYTYILSRLKEPKPRLVHMYIYVYIYIHLSICLFEIYIYILTYICTYIYAYMYRSVCIFTDRADGQAVAQALIPIGIKCGLLVRLVLALVAAWFKHMGLEKGAFESMEALRKRMGRPI